MKGEYNTLKDNNTKNQDLSLHHYAQIFGTTPPGRSVVDCSLTDLIRQGVDPTFLNIEKQDFLDILFTKNSNFIKDNSSHKDFWMRDVYLALQDTYPDPKLILKLLKKMPFYSGWYKKIYIGYSHDPLIALVDLSKLPLDTLELILKNISLISSESGLPQTTKDHCWSSQFKIWLSNLRNSLENEINFIKKYKDLNIIIDQIVNSKNDNRKALIKSMLLGGKLYDCIQHIIDNDDLYGSLFKNNNRFEKDFVSFVDEYENIRKIFVAYGVDFTTSSATLTKEEESLIKHHVAALEALIYKSPCIDPFVQINMEMRYKNIPKEYSNRHKNMLSQLKTLTFFQQHARDNSSDTENSYRFELHHARI